METLRKLMKVYKGCLPSFSTVQRWVAEFEGLDKFAEDDPREICS